MLTLYDFQRNSHFCYKFGDVVLTQFLEMFVILAWHGVWTLEDLLTDYMEWSNEISSWISVVKIWRQRELNQNRESVYTFLLQEVGLALALIMMLIQFPLMLVFNSGTVFKPIKFVLKFLFNVLGLFGTISSFRGVWYLLDEYYMTGTIKQ